MPLLELLPYATVPRHGLGTFCETERQYPKLRATAHKDYDASLVYEYDLQEWAVSALQSPITGTKSASTIMTGASLIATMRQHWHC